MANIFVDVEAVGISPANGLMTEFGAVEQNTKKTFHGKFYEAEPDPTNPSKAIITGDKLGSERRVMFMFAEWLKEVSPGQCTFISDNPAYDFQWINFYFDKYNDGVNPFGHSGRRISDFWAGFNMKWSETQSWKRFRQTPHDHNPVNDAMGNVEAFEEIMRQVDEYKRRYTNKENT
jgi:hypothetical protein